MTAGRHRFLLVLFTWHGHPKTKELEPLFGTAIDWLRISPNTWILYTSNDAELWFSYINRYLSKAGDTEDFVIISELNLSVPGDTYSGWQTKMVWDWIQKSR